MPTINMYQGGGGYYIRARPSDATGTITYKIRSFGTPVVREMGFKDGEEITWHTIDALKSLGIVYTDGSGTVAPDEFDPDSNFLQKHSISEQKAQKMLTVVQEHLEINNQELQDAADALGISYNQNVGENQLCYSKDNKKDSERKLSTTEFEGSSYPLVTPSVRYDELEPGEKYVGKIDRVSGSGNGIIELSGGLVNIGECDRSDVGNQIVFAFSEGPFCDVVAGISEPNTTTEKGYHNLGEYLTGEDRRLLDKS